ncbi:MAG: rod shape-determining protein MreC [Candidatus Aminicenantes bacterium]
MPLFSKEKKSISILAGLIFLQLVLISLQVPLEEENYLKRTVFSVFSAVQHGFAFTLRKIGEVWKSYFYLRDVMNQNEKMKEEMFFLRQENNLLRNALSSLMDEKEIKDRLSRLHESIMVARVIGLDASNFYKSMIIDKGLLDGLKKDMVVLDKYGNLAGRIVGSVSIKESRVQLITDTDSGVSVFSEKDKVPGVVSGDGEGGCDLDYILATQTITDGTRLITSGFDGLYPRGIQVGEIISVSTTTALFHNIKVKPYFDWRQLNQVAVLMKDPREIF